MSGEARLVLHASWLRGPWDWGIRTLFLLAAFALLLAEATNGFTPPPGRPGWQWGASLGFLILLVAGVVWSDLHRPAGWELLRIEGNIHLRELEGALYTRSTRVKTGQEVPLEGLRYLESQHGVILKGPEFHQDLFLPKDQTALLLEWLGAHDIQRFEMGEASK
ncbi:MAG: hypothetical protein U0P81_04335 [Holophagaceae bacterium]